MNVEENYQKIANAIGIVKNYDDGKELDPKLFDEEILSIPESLPPSGVDIKKTEITFSSNNQIIEFGKKILPIYVKGKVNINLPTVNSTINLFLNCNESGINKYETFLYVSNRGTTSIVRSIFMINLGNNIFCKQFINQNKIVDYSFINVDYCDKAKLEMYQIDLPVTFEVYYIEV